MDKLFIAAKSRAVPKTSRRDFLKVSAATGGGLVIGFNLSLGNKLALAQAAPAPNLNQPNAFLRIALDGTVTVQVKHLEFGQGVMTSLPMLLAEELKCDWTKIRAELAPAAPVYAHSSFGMQITGGSSSVSNSWEQLRTVGAMARTMLVTAAANRWKVAAGQCRAANGMVTGPGGKKAGYGELAEEAAKLPTPEKVALQLAKDFTIIGKPTRRIDAPAKVNGSARFGLDLTAKQIPNLHTAVVAHPPIFGARVVKFNADKVNGIPGITHVVQLDSGIAVVAKSFWAAKVGRDALQIEWDLEPGSKADSVAMSNNYRETARTPGLVAKKGNPDMLKGAAKTLVAEFEMPYLAHAAMEPLSCTVSVSGDKCELWVGSQLQTLDVLAAAKTAGVPPANVKLNTMLAGGGFGRRTNLSSDYVVEAVAIGKKVGVPVKMVWTREDDMKAGSYRPMYVHRIEAGLDANDKIAAWNHTVVGQSLVAGTPFEPAFVKDGVDGSSMEGIADTPYDIPNMHATLHTTKIGVPVLFWRSVGHSHTAYAMETAMDDLAKLAGQDPVAFRRAYLGKHPKVLKTLNLAAEKAGWGSALPKGRARGVAVHESFGSVVAHIVEVSMDKGELKLHRIVSAIDCGLVVNPLTVAAQVESSAVYGMSAAMHGKITLKDGVVEQSNFHNYPLLRMAEMPKVEVYIVPGGETPTGVGEPGLPPIAPAISNAIFALTGKRLRTLPFDLASLKV
ncbi:MAG: xanthine dehydrogenase family protein molybdopterin-binding subunit [Rhodocyclaceae bacterium]|nr:xanthine dehydrogenase family protein molybdopterin-binding subunit [Rhodocyclaceae bacterium]MCA3024058.1 xanthine dehydrogenase family protein molybdopterin-binding subunit [Rhodocyclaceae bacterium]MCA3027003.1 xanthine dehydrogenase family protein molybdopterin-binding subunit [Rhodocyclaceae bacterium]MCA3036636.1 xanthine dehydrogenase family protein molybdopterin-binding subunit [Rhodocyclaceae bacterium]MCA3048965.1 xanthine dehydrogenase family protein molybdopterin-binding subunit 